MSTTTKQKKFKNYRLWACDCTVQILPNTEENRKIGVHKNQYKEVASIKLLGQTHENKIYNFITFLVYFFLVLNVSS
jgi:hypothetical protein